MTSPLISLSVVVIQVCNRQSPVELAPLGLRQPVLTQLQGDLGGSTPKHLHIGVQPGHHVPRGVGGAVGHVLDLHRLQDTVPDVDLAQLPHKGLRGVEASTYYILLRP